MIYIVPPRQDALSQLESVRARLSSTEKALNDANARATALNSRIALVETDARIKVQDLQAKVGVPFVYSRRDLVCLLKGARPEDPIRVV